MDTATAFQRQYGTASRKWGYSFNAQDPLHQILKIVPGLQIVLAVQEASSWPASTDGVNLNAAQEVS